MPRRRKPLESKGKRRHWLSSLWPFCYSSVILITHSYLLYQAITRYLIYKTVLPQAADYQLPLICISALLLPAVVFISFIKFGTYTNDACQVGFDFLKKEISDKAGLCTSRIYMGAPPFAVMLHIVCAYLLLIGNVFAVATGRKNKIYTESSNIGNTFFLDWEMLSINSTNPDIGTIVIPSTNLELANLILSLLICSHRTVSVFWLSNKLFTLIYWIQSIAAIMLHVLSYIGFKTLYSEMVTTDKPTIFLLDNYALLLLYICSNLLLFVSSWCIFHFGYGVILEMIRNLLKKLGHHQGINSDCGAYLPHATALGSILFYVACNAPIMYDYVSMYSETKDRVLIVHLIACVLYMLLWIVIWFAFTIKQNWNFEIHEINLKRYAVLQNRTRIFVDDHVEDEQDENGGYPLHELQTGDKPTLPTSNCNDDNISNSTTSTNNGLTNRPAPGILAHKMYAKVRKKSSEQKVKFQEATKIVIETNLDSDLDTIPESDHTECDDSAMFSGSGGSNDSNDSPPRNQVIQDVYSNKPHRPVYKDMILNPNNIQLLAADPSRRTWSSTGDLNLNKDVRRTAEVAYLGVSASHSASHAAPPPYTQKNSSLNNNYVSNGHKEIFNDPGMSSAV